MLIAVFSNRAPMWRGSLSQPIKARGHGIDSPFSKYSAKSRLKAKKTAIYGPFSYLTEPRMWSEERSQPALLRTPAMIH